MSLKIVLIRIDSGETFEGSLEQFRDTYFDNVIDGETAWLEEFVESQFPGSKLEVLLSTK